MMSITYEVYIVNRLHNLLNEPKKWIYAYNSDKREPTRVGLVKLAWECKIRNSNLAHKKKSKYVFL